uniref:USC2-5p n=1 Tax=Myxococcus xanthus TaxID=34 RepID=Q93SK4_MYXXA|nr:USC2-5p [Myxococcus xanthus]
MVRHRQGDAGNRAAAGLHRGRRSRGRHRRGAGRIRRSCRRTDARSTAAGAQHPGRPGSSRAHPHRCSRQDHQRIRYRPHHRARRRLVQCWPRLYVRAGLHPVAELPYGQVPNRHRHPGPGALEAPGCSRQGDPCAQLPRAHAASLEGTVVCRGLNDPAELGRSTSCAVSLR